MKILLVGNKDRGKYCFEAIKVKHEIVGVVSNYCAKYKFGFNSFVDIAKNYNIPLFQPENINDKEVIQELKSLDPDLIVIAGYNQIVKREFIALAKFGCVNLHGGKLPEQRGSSPMNWQLINAKNEFSISIIQVDEGIDTGDILAERTFSIFRNDTINDLHKRANEAFPVMLIELIDQIESGTASPRKQDESKASYYPLRFPEDGLVLWDMLTAEEVHNHIRALTAPYPGAFTYYGRKKIKLLKSSLTEIPFYGEPGRIYKKTNSKVLVCARDKCLWIENCIDADTGEDFYLNMKVYEQFVTLRGTIKEVYENKKL